MAEPAAMLDDPAHLNTFLEMIGAAPINPAKHVNVMAQTEPPRSVKDGIDKENESKNEDVVSSIFASNKEEDNVEVLCKLADRSNLGLHHSKYAPSSERYQPKKTVTHPRFGEDQRKITPVMWSKWQDQIVESMRSVHADDTAIKSTPAIESTPAIKQEDLDEGDHIRTMATSTSASSPSIPFPPLENLEVFSKASEGSTAIDRNVSRDTQDTPTKSSAKASSMDGKAEQDSPKALNLNKEKISKDDSGSTKIAIAALQRATAHKIDNDICTSEVPNIIVTHGVDEDRENMTHFSSWGNPSKRDKPTARVRQVILSGLPPTADLTLVQSLISGGAIEKYVLGPSNTTAYVTFTTGDACEDFYVKHPNGIVFKYNGRACTVFADKGKEVDVVSGMLQGWLGCGASRCVRATGADEEWGMRALRKLAEGKGRKVENIIDIYRNKIRTIIFRFTSIADAVVFKSMLTRDENWEACNIQFMDDPCEKATGVHLE